MRVLFVKLATLILMLSLTCLAHDPWFTTSGWTGPYSGGGTDNSHPENLCKDYQNFVCVVGGVHTFGIGLGKWPVQIQHSGGDNYSQATNTASTLGWVVAIGVVGKLWTLSVQPGTHNSRTCSIMDVPSGSGWGNVTYGSSSQRRYYQVIMRGNLHGYPCQ